MTQAQVSELDAYFATVQQKGSIITRKQTERWSSAVLKTLGLELTRSAKRALAKALPQPLSDDLTRVFWLLHFRNPNLPLPEFQAMVARRAGHSDPQYARIAITGVFHGLQQLISRDVSDKVTEGLSPELRALWEQTGAH